MVRRRGAASGLIEVGVGECSEVVVVVGRARGAAAAAMPHAEAVTLGTIAELRGKSSAVIQLALGVPIARRERWVEPALVCS